MPVKRALHRVLGTVLIVSGAVVGCLDDDASDGIFPGSFTPSAGIDASPQIVPACLGVEQGEACGYGNAVTTCEVATFANIDCNALLQCASPSAEWKAVPPLHSDCESATCPAAYTETHDGGCNVPRAGTLICEYDEGTCGCAPVEATDASAVSDAGDAGAGTIDAGTVDASAYEWRCIQADHDAGCPRKRPRVGAECVRPLVCDYGVCVFEDGVEMDCYAGFWTRKATSRSTPCH